MTFSASTTLARFPENCDLDDLSSYISKVETFAHEAFRNKNSYVWQELQLKIFKINQELFQHGHALGTLRSLKNWLIRDTIERVELQYLPNYRVPEQINDVDSFVVFIKDYIRSHRVNNHPLFELFDRDDLTDKDIRYFLSNHWIYTQNFHSHIAAYSLFTPFEMREELFKNIYDELGQGNFAEAHPNLFKRLIDHFGGLDEKDINPETYYFFNTQVNLCWFADGLHYGIGGMGALELSVPSQHTRILQHLYRRGLSSEIVKFYELHCQIDLVHGDGWFAAAKPYLKTRDEFQKVLIGAARMLEARVNLYDGMLKGIKGSSRQRSLIEQN